MGGALAAPSTAYFYNFNMLTMGQNMWEAELMSYNTFPPLSNVGGFIRHIACAGVGVITCD
jgi:hypothetical protein